MKITRLKGRRKMPPLFQANTGPEKSHGLHLLCVCVGVGVRVCVYLCVSECVCMCVCVCRGFSCHGALSLECVGSVVAAHGLSSYGTWA